MQDDTRVRASKHASECTENQQRLITLSRKGLEAMYTRGKRDTASPSDLAPAYLLSFLMEAPFQLRQTGQHMIRCRLKHVP